MFLANNEELIKLIKDNIDVKQNYEKLYFQNKGFILNTIKSRVYGIYEIEDLLQIAFIAIVKAVQQYDVEKENASFLELYKYCIWNEIRSTQSELPAYLKSEIRRYKMIYNKLYKENGEEPSDKEMFQEMNISLEKLYKIKHTLQSSVSIDTPLSEDSDITIKDTIIDSKAHEVAQDELEKEDLNRIIRVALNKLTEKERNIIEKRYYKNFTFEKIGQDMNFTKARAKEIECNAILKLRRDDKFRKKVFDYTSLNEYKKVGVNEFNRTWTSSTEWVVLKRENIRSQSQ